MDPIQIGRRRLEAKDYEGAIAAFTQAVAISGSHLQLPALAGRAQAHVKMNDLKAALRDARQMIKTAPTCSKGYLATGAICQLMKTDEADQAALSIYERGLNKVRAGTDDQRHELEQMMTKLYSKKHEGKRADPFKTLPPELAMLVLQWLDMPDRVRCLAVSKAWKPFIESIPKIWTDLDLSATKRSISGKSLRAFIKRSLKKSEITLEKATIKWFKDSHKTLETVVSLCPNLNHLCLTSGYQVLMIGASLGELSLARNLKTLVLSSSMEIVPATIVKCLAACRTITRAEFRNVKMNGQCFKWEELHEELPCLEQLVLNRQTPRQGSDWYYLELTKLIPKTPNLKVGRFENWCSRHNQQIAEMPDISKWAHLEVLSFKDIRIDRMPRLPQSITCVDFTNHNCSEGFHFDDLQSLSRNDFHYIDKEEMLTNPSQYQLPNLEELHTNSSKSIHPALFSFLTRASISSNKLRILDIGNRPYEPISYPPCTSLTGLSLANSQDWGDDEILEMMKLYPNVKELNLSKTKVTGYALKKITKEWGPLEKVVLKGCENISMDAFDYLEGKGTLVCR